MKSLQPAPLLNFVLRALTTLACACTRIRVQYLDEEARVGASAAKPRMEAGSARGKHDLWSDGEQQEAVPRHVEINEKLATAILTRARRKV